MNPALRTTTIYGGGATNPSTSESANQTAQNATATGTGAEADPVVALIFVALVVGIFATITFLPKIQEYIRQRGEEDDRRKA